MRRVFDAAVLLGTDAVTGFVGRNPLLGMDANLVMFEEVFVPLLEQAKARGLTFRVEQRSEEHTSELQSQSNLVCRLLLEKKKQNRTIGYGHRLPASTTLSMHPW